MTEGKPMTSCKETSAEWDVNKGYSAMAKSGTIVRVGKKQEGQPGMGIMEILMAGLAGCAMMDIIEILKKQRQLPVKSISVGRGKPTHP